MTGVFTRRGLCCFADMLEYPRPSLPRAVAECQALLPAVDAGADRALRDFAAYVAITPVSRVEEAYTGMFDLDPKCHIYVGYHLFGDSYKRSAFLLGLKERFRAGGYDCGNELPDHLSELLRFLAVAPDAEVARELIEDAILPALDRMTGRSPAIDAEKKPGNAPEPEEPRRTVPYVNVLDALRLVLRAEVGGAAGGDVDAAERDLVSGGGPAGA